MDDLLLKEKNTVSKGEIARQNMKYLVYNLNSSIRNYWIGLEA